MAPDPLEAVFETATRPVAPGVQAVTADTADGLIVMWVKAESPGIGAVSAWLDDLPKWRRVVFVAAAGRLVGMLERRGFKPCRILTPGGDHWVEAHVRRPGGHRQ